MRRPDAALAPPLARTLAALIRVYARDGRATVQSVMVEAGYASRGDVHMHLSRLRGLGLAAWDDGQQATLRPTVVAVAV